MSDSRVPPELDSFIRAAWDALLLLQMAFEGLPSPWHPESTMSTESQLASDDIEPTVATTAIVPNGEDGFPSSDRLEPCDAEDDVPVESPMPVSSPDSGPDESREPASSSDEQTPHPPWTDHDVALLVEIKNDKVSRPRWTVVAQKLKRRVSDVQTQWAEVQPKKQVKKSVTKTVPPIAQSPKPNGKKPSKQMDVSYF